jgi:hypothetical protein
MVILLKQHGILDHMRPLHTALENLHLFLWRWEVMTQDLFGYPFYAMSRTQWYRKLALRQGVEDPEREIRYALNDDINGASHALASSHHFLLCWVFTVGTLSLVWIFSSAGVWAENLYMVIISGVLGFILSIYSSMSPTSMQKVITNYRRRSRVERRAILLKGMCVAGAIWIYGVGTFIVMLRMDVP